MIVKFDEKGPNHACEVDKKVSNDIPNTKDGSAMESNKFF